MLKETAMADIFLSYSKRDYPLAEKFASAFKQEGLSVWWDHELTVGDQFNKVIEEELAAATTVVVLWSEASTKSEYVLDEAGRGKTKGVLAPVRVADIQRPLSFGGIQTWDLIDWSGDRSDQTFKTLCEELRKKIPHSTATRKSYLLMAYNGPYLSKLRSTLLEHKEQLDIGAAPDIVRKGPDGDLKADNSLYRNHFEKFLAGPAKWLLTNLPTGMGDEFNIHHYLDLLVDRKGDKMVIFFDSGLQFRDAWADRGRPPNEAPFFILRPQNVPAAKALLLELEMVVKRGDSPVIFCPLFTTNIPTMNMRRVVYQTFLAGVVYRHEASQTPPNELWQYANMQEFVEKVENKRSADNDQVNRDLERLAQVLAFQDFHLLQWGLGKLEGSLERNSRESIRKHLTSLKGSITKGLVVFLCGNDEIAGTVHEELQSLELPSSVRVALVGFDDTEPIQKAARHWDIVCTAEVDFVRMRDEAEYLIGLEEHGPVIFRDRTFKAVIKHYGKLPCVPVSAELGRT
jgi:hypothetical protein